MSTNRPTSTNPTLPSPPGEGAAAPAEDLRDWLRSNAGLGAVEVVDALQRDQLRRWRGGERVPAETYLQLLPGDDGQGLDLIYGEYLLRRQAGEEPTLAEYLWRFPGYAEQLRALVELEADLGAAPPAVAGPPETLAAGCGGAAPARPRGPRVEGYEVVAELGRGAMGVVYEARHRALNRVVALKLIRADDEDARARFRLEAEAVARLQHPNIVQIHEVGEADDGSPYMALEYVGGGTLAGRLRTAPPTPREAAELVRTLAGAVHFAHQRGVLHRDLKPSNILLGVSGEPVPLTTHQPKVADFGLAKWLHAGEAARTRSGDVIGTPSYMAPERASGTTADVGTPADVYALGAILYELLSGRPPFRGGTALETLERVRSDDPEPPRRLRPGVPRDLETICLKCLRKEPGGRYGSAAELADDLGRFLDGEPVRARRVGAAGRLVRWCRRNPALASAVAGGVLAVAAAVTVGMVQVVHERDRFRTERDQAQANLYRALVGEARAQMTARGTGWWRLALDNLRDAGRLDVAGRDRGVLRELAIECMGCEEPYFREGETWAGHEGPVTALACGPDGRVAASGSRDGAVRLWSVPDGQPLAVLAGHRGTVTGLAFAPDGRQLASCSADGTVRLWDPAAADRPARTIDPGAGAVRQVAYSPDGLWLAAACEDGTIRLFPTAADRPAVTLRGHAGAVTCLAFAETGEFASGGADQTIRFWDLAVGRPTHTWATSNVPGSLAFNPRQDEDRQLAYTDTAAARFQVRQLDSDRTATMYHGHGGGVTHLRHAGGLWLTASADGALKLWRQVSTRLSEAAAARAESGAVLSAAVVPGGVVAGYADGRVRVWRIEDPRQRAWVRHPSHHAVFVGDTHRLVDATRVTDLSAGPPGSSRRYTPGAVRALAADPAGGGFALGREDGTLETWSWPAPRPLARRPGQGRAVTALAAGPDGRFAAASADGRVELWRWDGVAGERALEPGVGAVHAVAWGDDGRHLAACGERGVVLWDLRAGGGPKRLSERPLSGGAVAVGRGVVAFSETGGVIELRDLSVGGSRQLAGHTAPVSALAFSPDGSRLASNAADGTVRVWDPATGAEVDRVGVAVAGRSLAFDRSGRFLLCSGLPLLYDLHSRHPVARLYGVQSLRAACFSPDGAEVLLGGQTGGVLRCPTAEVERARAAAGNPAAEVRVDVSAAAVPGGHPEGVWGIAASPDGRWVATAGHDTTVKLWDAAAMTLVRTLEGHGEVVWSVAFSPDSKLVASGSVAATGGEIRVWDVETGRQVWRFEGHERLVTALAFHPHRPWLASGSYDGSVLLWDVARGEALGRVHRFDRQRVHDLAFRPDGRRLAAAGDDFGVAVWDVGDDPPAGPPGRRSSGHPAGVRSVAFSPDGRVLASGAEQGVVTLWDGETFDRVVTLRGGRGQVRGLSFSRDGTRLAAAGYTAPTIVWDVAAVRGTLRGMNLDW